MKQVQKKEASFTLIIPKKVAKQIEDIDKNDRSKILEKLRLLESNTVSLDVKKLAGYVNLYRVRAGNYRIIYEIQDQKMIILIVAVGQRKNIYQQLKNLFD